MPSNWDYIENLPPEIPTFTREERRRITKVHNELQEKHDPVAAYCRKHKIYPSTSSRDWYEMKMRLRDAERAGE